MIALQDMGHKRLAIEAGEDPVNNPIEYMLECINTIYSHQAQKRRHPPGQRQHRRHHRGKLPQAEGGRHRHLHPVPGDLPQGKLLRTCIPPDPSSNYDYHTEAMDRAMEGGIDDVGLGVLFGLELYRYEFAGLLMHAEHLEAVHGVGPHTISVPRVKHGRRHRSRRVRQRH